jgi:hypothetical protein
VVAVLDSRVPAAGGVLVPAPAAELAVHEAAARPEDVGRQQVFVSQLWRGVLLPQRHRLVAVTLAVSSNMRVYVRRAVSAARMAAAIAAFTRSAAVLLEAQVFDLDPVRRGIKLHRPIVAAKGEHATALDAHIARRHDTGRLPRGLYVPIPMTMAALSALDVNLAQRHD